MKFGKIGSNLKLATRETLSSFNRWAVFTLLSLGIFMLFVFVPVWTTPGNDFFFQLSLFPVDVLLLMITLSVFNALLILMQYHVRKKAKVGVNSKQAATGFGIVTSSIAATLACASCYSSVLAIFGLGGTIFIVEHRWWFAAFAFTISIIALIYTANRIVDGCEECRVVL